MKSSIPLFLISATMLGYGALGSTAQEKKSVNFDRDVLPILSQKCYKCHGPDAAKAAAGLRLDLFDVAVKMHALTPGSPDQSNVILRVAEKDPDDRMPPPDSGVKPLTAEQIEILRTWIRSGAKYEPHWSYVPPVMPTLPKVSDPKWARNPIDQFVMAKLDLAGLKPESEADKETLAMRAAQTLTGLPPSQANLETYRKDIKPGAYERFVDRLLASPTYGEHQARYWLDAVRYGDTHGLQLDNERGVYPYRDWVVRAYNEDLPFTKFVEWQLAGDLLPKPTTEQLIATGYVRMNLTSNEGGAIEEEFLARNTFDRVDTTGTVMLGLTIQCSRCHDHKYDPIKQKDYYGLYAFFNSTTDKPLDGNITYPPPVVRAATPDQEQKLNAMTQKAEAIRDHVDLASALKYFEANHKPVPVGHDWEISPVYGSDSFDHAFDQVFGPEPGQTSKVDWKPFKLEIGKDMAGIIGKDNASVYVRGKVMMSEARRITFGVSSDDAVKVWLNGKLIHSHKVGRGVTQEIDQVTGDFLAGENELLIKVINGVSFDGLNLRLYDTRDKVIDDALGAYRKNPSSPAVVQALKVTYLEVGPQSPDKSAYDQLIKAKADLTDSIPMSLIAQEMDKPRPTFILKRGEYNQPGDAVTRHVPSFLGALPTGVKADRLSLARWLTSPTNPLLARVFVNRVWQQYFGVGIVKTAEDFGSQGEWPTDQPLLDYLAVAFQKSGWSVKALNRMIVTSAAFRQSSKITPQKLAKDPENRLISRGPRFRMDAEVIRDKALLSSGLLVEEIGGKGFKPYQPDGIWENASDPASATHIYVRDHGTQIYRRSIYLFWKRTAPPPSMVNLDAPLRDTCIVRRSTTNTPLQALTTENDPTFLEASRVLAQRLVAMKGDDAQRLARAYEATLGRAPKATETTLLTKALAYYRQRYESDPTAAKKLVTVGDAPPAKDAKPAEQAAWMLICSTLMNTDEFFTIH